MIAYLYILSNNLHGLIRRQDTFILEGNQLTNELGDDGQNSLGCHLWRHLFLKCPKKSFVLGISFISFHAHSINPGIPNRAKRHAFHRDVKSGKISGVVVMDVVNAVNDVFQENLPLEHSFAFNEFMEEFSKEASEAHQKKLEKD